MNLHALLRTSTLLHVLIAGILAPCLLPLTGCERAWTTHDLQTLATSSLSPTDRNAVLAAAEGLRPGDHTPATLAQATTLLAEANAGAPSPSTAKAMQAVVVNRLFACCAQRPTLNWLTPEATPDLWAQLNETFNQTDSLLRSKPPDVATVMVWGLTGTALNRAPEIHSLITLAQSDEKLRQALREDDPTRDRLLDYAHATEHRFWLDEATAVLYREPGNSFGDAVGERAMLIVAIPVLAVLTIVWVVTGHSPI